MPSKQLAFANDEGLRVLHLACLEEELDVVELLLQAGTQDPWASDNEGTNCLHIAATLSSPPMLKLLLEAPQKKGLEGEHVDEADQQGSTALRPDRRAGGRDGRTGGGGVRRAAAPGRRLDLRPERRGQDRGDLAILAEVRSVVDAAKKGASRRRKRPTDPSTPDKKGGGGEEEEEAGRQPVAVPRGRASGGRVVDEAGDLETGGTGGAAAEKGGKGSAAPTGGSAEGADDVFIGVGEAAEESQKEASGGKGRLRRLSSGGRGGARLVDGDDLPALIAEQAARLEEQLTEAINASEASAQEQYDLAIELLPSEYADDRLDGMYERPRSASRGGGNHG